MTNRSDELGGQSISVIIPAFNRIQMIGGAIESVLGQDYPLLEVIVVDGGSSDALAGTVRRFGERIRVVRQAVNKGASAARNAGIAAAEGKYLAFLDSDDVWKPGKLRQQMAFMALSSLDISCTNFELVAPGQSLPKVVVRPYEERIGRDKFLWGCYISPGSTLIIKRSLLLECGGYDTSFPRYEDWDLLLRLTMNGKHEVGFLNAPLASIYLGSSPGPEAVAAGLERMLECHFDRLNTVDPSLARRLLSAVEFSRASLYAREGRYVLTGWKLLKSLSHWPIGNQAFQMILMPKLRHAILAQAKRLASRASQSV